MARKLPWKTDSGASPGALRSGLARPPKAGQSSGPPAAKPAARHDLRAPSSQRHDGRVSGSATDAVRSPSTSPPPERPEEKFMIAGPLNDDRYRMVEDEFLHVAQLFTAHLHRAEYDRLKALARTQNAATIREIERPVVAASLSPTAARRRHESVRRLAKQRAALQHADAAGEAADELLSPWKGTALQGLMDVPGQQQRRALMPSVGASSSRTRAAAGFIPGRSSPPQLLRQVERQSAPSASPSKKKTPKDLSRRGPAAAGSDKTPVKATVQARAAFQAPTRSSPQQPLYFSSSALRNVATASDRSTARSCRSRNAFSEDRRGGKPRVSFFDLEDDDDEDDDPFGINERRMNRKKSREPSRKPEVKPEIKTKRVSLDAIPSFL